MTGLEDHHQKQTVLIGHLKMFVSVPIFLEDVGGLSTCQYQPRSLPLIIKDRWMSQVQENSDLSSVIYIRKELLQLSKFQSSCVEPCPKSSDTLLRNF